MVIMFEKLPPPIKQGKYFLNSQRVLSLGNKSSTSALGELIFTRESFGLSALNQPGLTVKNGTHAFILVTVFLNTVCKNSKLTL